MIVFQPAHLTAIVAAAEAAYPEECCGLLVGHGIRIQRVTRVVPSPNLRTGSGDRFEVDPAVRFRLMRELEGRAERIIGHYHSHPDHPSDPSSTDRAMAFEPELVWVITAVAGGRVIHTAAHRIDPATGKFRAVALRLSPPKGRAKKA